LPFRLPRCGGSLFWCFFNTFRQRAGPPCLLLVVDELAAVALGAEGKENLTRLERMPNWAAPPAFTLSLPRSAPAWTFARAALKRM